VALPGYPSDPADLPDEMVSERRTRAVFLDRDGVLTIPEFRDGRSFAPRHLADFRLYDTAGESLASLKNAGFRLVVVTNQPDVGNGLIDKAVVEEMHRRLAEELPVDAIEVCYHRQRDGCDRRKPKAGMIWRAAERLRLDCGRSFIIGDRASDVEAGRGAGCTTIFIDLGYTDEHSVHPDFVAGSLSEATKIILSHA
jgi:D-glycero-D-manno-heptose 1,7-bisphosphate phosphatase